MSFTSAQINEYLKSGCSACPVCGSDLLAIDSTEINGNKITVKVDCYGCGQSINEICQVLSIEPAA